MALTDAKRKANNKYIKEHMTTMGCKMRKDYAEEFKAACRMAGKTPNAIFKAAADQFLADYNRGKTEE